MAFLTLAGAKILQEQGFGGDVHSSSFAIIEFEEQGILSVYHKPVFGACEKIYWFNYLGLALLVGTQSFQSGGGWSGGGFGAKGVVEGVLAASLLNALTTKHHKYTVLTVVLTDATGTQKSVSLGFKNIDEITLRNKLAHAVPAWMEPVVTQIETTLLNCADSAEASRWFTIVTSCQKNAILNDEQAERLFVVVKRIVPELFRKPAQQIGSASRAEQLKILSELRNSSVLTEEEFQVEKLRVLST